MSLRCPLPDRLVLGYCMANSFLAQHLVEQVDGMLLTKWETKDVEAVVAPGVVSLDGQRDEALEAWEVSQSDKVNAMGGRGGEGQVVHIGGAVEDGGELRKWG